MYVLRWECLWILRNSKQVRMEKDMSTTTFYLRKLTIPYYVARRSICRRIIYSPLNSGVVNFENTI